MPNDQFGRPVAVGDTVIIKGEVTKVLDDPNFINCTVKLAQQMPPAGTEVKVELNTAQVEKQGGDDAKSQAGTEKEKSPAQPPPPSHQGRK